MLLSLSQLLSSGAPPPTCEACPWVDRKQHRGREGARRVLRLPFHLVLLGVAPVGPSASTFVGVHYLVGLAGVSAIRL